MKSFLQTEHNTDGTKKVSSRFATDTGSADVYAVAPVPAWTAYVKGQFIIFDLANAPTGASTLNVSALGAKTMLKINDQAIASGDYEAGQMVIAIYDGTNFQIIGISANVALLDASNVFTVDQEIEKADAALIIDATTGNPDIVFHRGGALACSVRANADDSFALVGNDGLVKATWDLSGSDAIHSAGTVPLARMQRTEVINSATGITITSGGVNLTTVNMGTVNSGDRIFYSAYMEGSKGATAGENLMQLSKSAGTSTIAFLNALTTDSDSAYFDSTGITRLHISGIIQVTGLGTLTLLLKGFSFNSDTTSGLGHVHAIVLNNG